MLTTNPFDDDKLREECGVFGIWGSESGSAVTALRLHALQDPGAGAAGGPSPGGPPRRSPRAPPRARPRPPPASPAGTAAPFILTARWAMSPATSTRTT